MQEQRAFYRRCMDEEWGMQLSGLGCNGQALCRVQDQVEVIMPRVYVHTERSVVTSKATYNVTSWIRRVWFTGAQEYIE
jgi:hypothetical protein